MSIRWGYILNPWREIRRLRAELDAKTALAIRLSRSVESRIHQVDGLHALLGKAAEATGFEGDMGSNYEALAAWFDLVSARPEEKHGIQV